MAKHSMLTLHGGIGSEQVVLSVDLKEGDRREEGRALHFPSLDKTELASVWKRLGGL